MSKRTLTRSGSCGGCGCGCGQSSCNDCCSCNSCCGAMQPSTMHTPSYFPAASTSETDDCDPPCWAEELLIDFDPLWQGSITNGEIKGGKLMSIGPGPMTFESKPISMSARDAYIVELEAPAGVVMRYRYANTIEGLANQQYINANGVDKNFMYLQVLATVEND